MRRNFSTSEFLRGLRDGDPIAYFLAGFLAVIACVALFGWWINRQDRRRMAEMNRERWSDDRDA